MGHPPTDNDLYTIVISSLPPSYNSYISSVYATSSVLGATMSADDLMQTLTDEYERRTLNAKASLSKKEENAAFYSHEGSSSKGKGHGKGGSRKSTVECFNCKKKGHYKADCWAEGGGKEGQGPKGKGKGKGKEVTDAAASAKSKDSDDSDAAWMAMSAFSDDSEMDEDIAEAQQADFSDNDFYVSEIDEDIAEDQQADSSDGNFYIPPNLSFSVNFSLLNHLYPDNDAISTASNADTDATDPDMPGLMSADEFFDMPGLMQVSDSEDEDSDDDDDGEGCRDASSGYWTDETDADDEEMFGLLVGVTESEEEEEDEGEFVPVIADEDDKAFTTTFNSAMLSTGGIGNSLVDVDLYDSGASRHMSGYRHRFINFVDITPKPIVAADKRSFNATGQGDMYVDVPMGEGTSRVLLRDVLYAPSMGVTLVSISQIALAGYIVIFSGTTCRILNKEKVNLGRIDLKNGLYRVYSARPELEGYHGRVKEILTINELHRRLGHVGHDAARRLVEKGLVTGVELDESSKPTFCASCDWGKGHRKAIQKVREGERASAVGEEIHSDLWGPASVETINRKEYFVSFTDDYSRFTVVYLIRNKSDTFESYLEFEAWLFTQFGFRIKKLHSDRGGEYLSHEFTQHLARCGTIRRLTVHDTPEYNGTPERLNRTLLEKVRAMLHDAKLPKFLWGEALCHAVFVKNRTWTRSLKDTTPFEMLTGSKPDLSNIHPWGCKVSVHDTAGGKLDGRSKEGRWVGFDDESKAHRIYWENKRTVTIERNVKFLPEDVDIVVEVVALEGENAKLDERDEGEADNQPMPLQRATVEDVPDCDAPEVLPEEEDVEGGRGKRVRKESTYVRRLRDGEGSVSNLPGSLVMPRGLQLGSEVPAEDAGMVDAWKMVSVEDFAMAAAMSDAENLNPTFTEARKRSDWPKWEQAIQAELASLRKNETWEIVPRPSNANVVDCKWVLRIKKNAAGEIDKYKARLVARGFTQVHGVDFYETYAPVAPPVTVKLINEMLEVATSCSNIHSGNCPGPWAVA